MIRNEGKMQRQRRKRASQTRVECVAPTVVSGQVWTRGSIQTSYLKCIPSSDPKRDRCSIGERTLLANHHHHHLYHGEESIVFIIIIP